MPTTGGSATPVEPPPDAAIAPPAPAEPTPGPITNPSSELAAPAPANPCGVGAIGAGHYGTMGHGAGDNPCGGARSADEPKVTLTVAKVKGALDPAVVRRYLRRDVGKYRSCYEKELAAKPGLAGTVTIAFTIDALGHVSEAKASGLATVDECDGDVLHATEFPKPKDGQPVTATAAITYAPK